MKNTINDMLLSPHLAAPSEAALSHSSKLDDLHLSPHFTLAEFCKPGKYPDNIPTSQHVDNMAYGCRNLLDSFVVICGHSCYAVGNTTIVDLL